VDGGALYRVLCPLVVAVGVMLVFFLDSWVSGLEEHLDDCRVADAALQREEAWERRPARRLGLAVRFPALAFPCRPGLGFGVHAASPSHSRTTLLWISEARAVAPGI
jgi:hypothetical protein